jgi:hypothetical protein
VGEETILGSEEATEEPQEGADDNATLVTEPESEAAPPEDGADKPDDAKDGTTKEGEDGVADKPVDAPEKYEDFVVPDGVVLDPATMDEANGLFKEMNLSQENAQKLIDFQAKRAADDMKSATETWSKTMEDWATSAKNDKEFGGEKFNANIAIAKEGKDAFGGEGFDNMLEETGVGNHPEMLRFLVKVGAVVKEHDILQGTSSARSNTSAADRMYPTMKK